MRPDQATRSHRGRLDDAHIIHTVTFHSQQSQKTPAGWIGHWLVYRTLGFPVSVLAPAVEGNVGRYRTVTSWGGDAVIFLQRVAYRALDSGLRFYEKELLGYLTSDKWVPL